MFDWEARIANMNKARVDIAITSLTCPNVYWGSAEVSLKAARVANDDMAKAQKTWPERIRWFASLPWQHEELALQGWKSLRQRCGGRHGAGQHRKAPDRRIVHKSGGRSTGAPCRFSSTPARAAGRRSRLHEFQLTAPIGFTFDTSLAVARCIYDGFFDRYPNLKLIASHGGGALPYLVGRLDICWDNIPAARAKTADRRATTCAASM